jgi:NifU-like protein involved in Fe-S cluster formation
MDELVIKYYRKLLRTGFTHAGSLPNPDIFLDSVGEKIAVCGHSAQNYMHIFIKLAGPQIEDIKYLCNCDPTANVVVEILCTLVKGKTLAEAETLTKEAFADALGSSGEDFLKKSAGIIELLYRGTFRYCGEHPGPQVNTPPTT